MGEDDGYYALLRAVFDQAREDLNKDNGHADSARAFLDDPCLAWSWFEDWVDCGYYTRMLDDPGPDRDAEIDKRIRGMDRWGASRTEIVLALWGTISAAGYERVARVLGPKRGDLK